PGKRLRARDRNALEQRTEYPEKGSDGKDCQHDLLAWGEGAQLAILLVKVLPTALDFADVGAKQDTRNQQPGDRQEDERKRSAHQQPVEETHFLAECLLDVAHGDAVRR